ncbi:hypothetical protein G9A89_005657 [Geosiphon pyriformis]|nr:hypothetical protein G9A89_005657 [Geosiphon pyriformis]
MVSETVVYPNHPQAVLEAINLNEHEELQKAAIWGEIKFMRTVLCLGMLLQGTQGKASANIIDEALIAGEELSVIQIGKNFSKTTWNRFYVTYLYNPSMLTTHLYKPTTILDNDKHVLWPLDFEKKGIISIVPGVHTPFTWYSPAKGVDEIGKRSIGRIIRIEIVALIYEALIDGCDLSQDEKNRLYQKAECIEEKIYNCGSNTAQEYKNKTRSHIWNLKKNLELRKRVANGDISEADFVNMDAEAMATPERRNQNQAIRKEALNKAIIVHELEPIEFDDTSTDDPHITLGPRAGKQVWSGADTEART